MTERAAYRIAEVMAMLGCSRDTIDRAIGRGDLRSFTVGRARFVSAKELERFIAEREEKRE